MGDQPEIVSRQWLRFAQKLLRCFTEATEKEKTNTQLSQDKGGQEGKYTYFPRPHRISRTMTVGRNALYAVSMNVVPNPTESDKVVPDEKICR